MPLAHLEAVAAALGPVRLRAVGVVGGPALRMDAPQGPGLDSTRAALLPCAMTPLTWRRGRQTESHNTKQCQPVFPSLKALESVFVSLFELELLRVIKKCAIKRKLKLFN